MKVVCLYGSPRPNGNSVTIAARFLEKSRELGAEVESYHLNKLTYRGCQGCQVCKSKMDKCVLRDDLKTVLETVADADVLVLSTPVYFGDITSQMKAFVDRSYSYLVPDFFTSSTPSRLKPGKTLVFVIAQAAGENDFDDIYPRYEYFFKSYGYSQRYLVRGCGLNRSGDAADRESLMREAEKIALEIFKSADERP